MFYLTQLKSQFTEFDKDEFPKFATNIYQNLYQATQKKQTSELLKYITQPNIEVMSLSWKYNMTCPFTIHPTVESCKLIRALVVDDSSQKLGTQNFAQITLKFQLKDNEDRSVTQYNVLERKMNNLNTNDWKFALIEDSFSNQTMAFFTAEEIEKLGKYTCDKFTFTPLDRMLHRLVWNPISQILPLRFNSNLILIINSLIPLMITFYVTPFNTPDLSVKQPNWIWLLTSCCIWIFQSLDGVWRIHGKMSERKYQLAVFTDYAFNCCISTGCVGLLIVQAVGYGNSLYSLVIMAVVMQSYYIAIWEQQQIQCARLQSSYLGASEQFVMFHIVLLFNYFISDYIWKIEIFEGFVFEFWLNSIITVLYILTQVVIRFSWRMPELISNAIIIKKSFTCIVDLIPPQIIFICQLALYFLSISFSKYLLFYILLYVLSVGGIMLELSACSMVQKDLNWNRFDLPVMVSSTVGIIVYEAFTQESISQEVIALIVMYFTLNWIRNFIQIYREISIKLKQSIFSKPKGNTS